MSHFTNGFMYLSLNFKHKLFNFSLAMRVNFIILSKYIFLAIFLIRQLCRGHAKGMRQCWPRLERKRAKSRVGQPLGLQISTFPPLSKHFLLLINWHPHQVAFGLTKK
jgi:hypothetical protein